LRSRPIRCFSPLVLCIYAFSKLGLISRIQSFGLLAAIVVVYSISAFVDVMEVDAAQYASIAREMLERGEYLQVTNRYVDYLDKPPLLFWLSAFSFNLFGISNFAFKLPSLLFALLGIISTYKLGKLLYTEQTGLLAALIFASCQAMFLITNDVRTDTILTGAIIFSIWSCVAFVHYGKWTWLVAASLGIATGMLAKGPIGIMAPGLSLGAHFVLRREWKSIFKWQWIVMVLVVAVLISPMLWGLYQQFDAHPEKGVSGVRFFLWDQSFGRLTGDNPFVNSQKTPQPSAPLFFVHTVIWAFLPWSLFLILGLARQAKALFNARFLLSKNEEAITLGGFVLVFLGMSLSAYKLPHYIFTVFPLAAIITANYIQTTFLNHENGRVQSGLFRFHAVVLMLIWLALVAFCTVSFPLHNLLLWIVIIALFGLFVFVWRGRMALEKKLIIGTVVTMIAVNFMLSGHFYPTLLSYQSNTTAGKFATENSIPAEKFVSYRIGGHALDYYSQRAVPWLSEPSSVKHRIAQGQTWVFTNLEGKSELESAQLLADSVIVYKDFRVTMLRLSFFIPSEREKMLNEKFLLGFNQRTFP
jgi:4-amino-4-deoxy-L-arabinose transferase-like glycosyltransferase